MDGRTDKAACRVACKRIKIMLFWHFELNFVGPGLSLLHFNWSIFHSRQHFHLLMSLQKNLFLGAFRLHFGCPTAPDILSRDPFFTVGSIFICWWVYKMEQWGGWGPQYETMSHKTSFYVNFLSVLEIFDPNTPAKLAHFWWYSVPTPLV